MMKVIDLLNKIANGEEVPEKIIYRGYSFKYHLEVLDYKNDNSFNEDYLFDRIDSGLKLTDEVEIIEGYTSKEDKKIEKLGAFNIKKFYDDYPETAHFILEMFKKQEELIDKVNGEDHE